MSDAKPYTMERLNAVLSEWEQGGKPRFVSEDLRATVRALDAANARVAELEAEVAHWRKLSEMDSAETMQMMARAEKAEAEAAALRSLRAELAALKAKHAEELRAVAERQREACGEHLARVWYGLPDGRADHGPVAVIRATPLVTEET